MGNSVSSWSEAVLFSLLFIAVLGVVVAAFNSKYDEEYVVPFVDGSGSEQLFVDYQDNSQQQIKGGEVDFDAETGITLKSSYGLATDMISIVWNFLTGGWIEQVVGSFNLGESGTALAKVIKILWFLSLVFALLYGLFKVVL